MKRCGKAVFSALLSLALFLSMTLPCFAADKKVTLKVAFYPLNGFFEYDAQGKESGYGVELLKRISRYTGINFEYVSAPSWESTKQMLLDGEADIRMPGSFPTAPSATLSYSTHSVLDTYHAIMTLQSRTDLFYADYANFKNLKFAISKNFYSVTDVKKYLENLDLTEQNLVFFDEYEDCRSALNNGKVDGVITNVMDMTDDMKVLARFNSLSNYITMTKDNPYLETIDNALYLIKLDDPTFMSDLYKQYFPDRTQIPLSKQEYDFVKKLPSVKVVFAEKQGYLSHKDPDGYAGFFPGVTKKIFDKLGVNYETVSSSEASANYADGNIYVVPDFFFDYVQAAQAGTSISSPYFTLHYYQLQKKNSQLDWAHCTVAAVRNITFTEQFILPEYDESRIVWCDDFASCLDAVLNGKADTTFVNNYISEYYLSQYQYTNLSSSLIDYKNQSCFAVYGDATGLLASAISKLISSLTEDELNTILIQNTAKQPEQDVFKAMFYTHPIESISLVTAAAVLLVILVFLILMIRQSRKQNLALQKATNAKSDFLSYMSHDIRTPMNAIIGTTALAKEELDDPAVMKQYLSQIDSSSHFLLSLINDVLDLSKIENDALTLSPKPYSLENFKDQILNTFQPLCNEKSIHFSFSSIGTVPHTVSVDRTRFNQVFFNLLSNAVKFTPQNGEISLLIEAEPPKDNYCKLRFLVRDTGIGMSEDFQQHMFDAFSQEQSHHISEQEGTGIGLAIVKKLITAMGGTIEVDSTLTKGTTFTISLMLLCCDASDQTSAAKKSNETVCLTGKKLLLCEDHAVNAQIAKKLLERRGISVVHVENGMLAVEAFRSSPVGEFDAILMDIRMPVMDGLTATRQIRASERADAASIPIVAMTANAFDEDVQKSLEAGMNAHITKPIEPPVLYRVLEGFFRCDDLQE